MRSALIQLRVPARDFAGHPNEDLIRAFDASLGSATHSVDAIYKAGDAPTRQKLGSIRIDLKQVAEQFGELADAQKRLGFTEDDGTRSRMTKAAAAIERIINEDMSWMTEADARKLLISLLTMRRYETEYRLNRTTLLQTMFFDESKKFTGTLDGIVAADVLKEQLGAQVNAYSDTFAEWIDLTDQTGPPPTVIEYNIKHMIPVADEIIGSTKIYTAAASIALDASMQRTRNIITGVGLAAVLIGLGFSWLIGRSITRRSAVSPR
jgi:methyl-accepting chemotaxis protein